MSTFDFVVNRSVEKLDGVPEDFRGLYRQDGEKFTLDSEHAGVRSAISAVTAMSKTITNLRGEAQEHKKRAAAVDLSLLSEYGDSTERIASTFKERLAEAEKSGRGKDDERFNQQITKIKADLQAAHVTSETALKTEIESLTKQLHGELVTSQAMTALATAGALDAEVLLPHIASQVKVSKENGRLVVSVVDKQGDARFSGATGGTMTIGELVKEMRSSDRYKAFFKSEGTSGGGTSNSGGGSRRSGWLDGRDTKDLSPNEKIQRGLQKNGILSSTSNQRFGASTPEGMK